MARRSYFALDDIAHGKGSFLSLTLEQLERSEQKLKDTQKKLAEAEASVTTLGSLITAKEREYVELQATTEKYIKQTEVHQKTIEQLTAQLASKNKRDEFIQYLCIFLGLLMIIYGVGLSVASRIFRH